MATTCCRPRAVVCGQGRRSSGATTAPSAADFSFQSMRKPPPFEGGYCPAFRCGTEGPLVEELQVLGHEIAADVLGIGVDQLLRDRPRRLAVADRRAVEALDRQDAEAG